MPEQAAREERRKRQDQERGDRTVERFRASMRGLRRVFEKHFPDQNGLVDSLAMNLAKVEAQLPNVRQAIRSARYPGAGNRGPRRFALGLHQNLSFIEHHLKTAMDALESLAGDPSGHTGEIDLEDLYDEDTSTAAFYDEEE